MKLSFLLILAVCLQVSAKVYSQKDIKLTLHFTDIRLDKALSAIEKKSNYRFLYSEDVVPVNKQVSLQAEGILLTDILNELLANTDLHYKLLENNVVIIAPKGQEIRNTKVSGTVTDSKGTPLVGVSVKVKNTNKGIVTNEKGYFELTVPDNAVLILTYIGYQTQELPANGTDLKITMKEGASSLNEAVVVGYGTQKKINLTGAVAQVSGEVLENRAITTVDQGLQGVVPGLNVSTTYAGGGSPGAPMSVNIRGYTGLGTSTSGSTTDGPLVLIDGVPGDMNTLNALDIESISVLKDAASSAIYGSRAPYGVILITTKKGKKGRTSVNVSSNVSFSQPINTVKMVNSLEWADIMNEAAANTGQAPVFTDATIQRMKDFIKDPAHTPGTVPDPSTPSSNTYGTWFLSDANTDWFKVFFKDVATNQQQNISMSGGSDKTTYYLGLGYTSKAGLYNYGDDRYHRYNVRANISSEVNKWLTVNFRSTYANSNLNTPYTYPSITGGNWMHQMARKWPNLTPKNPDGQYSQVGNIALMTDGGRIIDDEHTIGMNGEVIITPLPGWQITTSLSNNYAIVDYQAQEKDVPAYYVDGTTYGLNNSPDQISKNVDLTSYVNANVYTSYEKNAGRHYFKALVGYQQEVNKYRQLSGSNTSFYDTDLPSLSLTYGTSTNTADKLSEWATQGVFMRFNYNFSEKYLVEFNGRYDGSSRFAPGKRWGFFPSVSAGYNIFKENFWQPISPYINTLKIRGSYGKLGDNNGVSNYAYVDALRTTAPGGTNWIFSGNSRAPFVRQPGSLISPDLTWSKPAMLDFGADATFLKDRLSFTYDWYQRKTADLIGPARGYPAVLGATAPVENNSSIVTTGFDLSIGWRDQINAFHYGVRLVMADYRAKVLYYPNSAGLLSTWYSGEQMGEIWGYKTAGLFKSKEEVSASPDQSKLGSPNWSPGDVRYKELNGDNIISPGSNTLSDHGDLTVIGNTTPRYNYGLTLDGSWKRFDFSLFLQGVAKRDVFINSNYFWGINGSAMQSTALVQLRDRWTVTNPDGYFPKFYLTQNESNKNEQVQTRYLQNAAYMRVKNLRLGYSLPVNWSGKIVQRCYFYISGENLLTFTKLQKSMDPEAALSDGKVYPLQRTFSAGINLNL